MNLKIGIVGLPNAGKSTLFNALLKKSVADVAPYPFCTIEPNVGVVPVPDVRLERLAEVTKEEEKMDKLPPLVPAIVEFVDIAGLVAGASKGEGLGNKFLSHIREVDLICHVVRNFVDPSVVHVAGEINPLRDKDIIETELILADLQTLEKQQEPFGYQQHKPQPDRSTKEDFERFDLVVKLRSELNNGRSVREIITDEFEQEMVRDLHLLSMKPTLFVINVNEEELSTKNNTNNPIIPMTNENTLVICAKTEAELVSLTPEEQKEYLTALGVKASGLDLLIQKAYQMLGLISFLTTGVIEARAWTIVTGTKAPQAAGTIHTDFEKKFIKADCVSYTDFINPSGLASPKPSEGGWKKSRELGKVRQEGREYSMRDGDVVEFKIGA
ncbi:MAG: GTP-binding protein YchF [Candidatus Gottesmanbacteria bacterium GW2011_GWB1_44_11c]|uniref:Ribosome-binding ATPase YchF n=1 Tax=Candidatus Gottesmanbacteria bacterium GW2011_GWB1_44_11c TaxID=1618447 RepID=A0A0G1GHI5_9BACT|nr:MAG: GTP-binding protein YchF [Candidatus Gottesmanbacteria bacterium GW2011_GWB1_44_11c]